jgi:hypothetical protein
MTKKRAKPAPRERGEYRSIPTVLLDGPDFQALPNPETRWVFVACKIKCGPCGLAVIAGMESAIAEWTGLDVPSVTRALAHLDGKWIRRERSVLWILGGLLHEPSRNKNDKNHRASVVVFLAGLPRLTIVRDFVNEHREWCEENGKLDNRLAWVDEESPRGPSGVPVESRESPASTEDGRRKTDDGIRSVSARTRSTPKALPEKPTDRIPVPVYDHLHRAWTVQAGAVDVGRFRKAVKPLLLSGVRAGQLERAMGRYLTAMRERGRDAKLEWFTENVQTWIREADLSGVELMTRDAFGFTEEQAAEHARAHYEALERADTELHERLTRIPA